MGKQNPQAKPSRTGNVSKLSWPGGSGMSEDEGVPPTAHVSGVCSGKASGERFIQGLPFGFCEVGPAAVHILHLRKRRHREAKQLPRVSGQWRGPTRIWSPL